MVKRHCSICKKEKDSAQDFYWSQGKRQARCKKCQIGLVRLWQKHHPKQTQSYKDKYSANHKPSYEENNTTHITSS